jgi:hypothetical protein
MSCVSCKEMRRKCVFFPECIEILMNKSSVIVQQLFGKVLKV